MLECHYSALRFIPVGLSHFFVIACVLFRHLNSSSLRVLVEMPSLPLVGVVGFKSSAPLFDMVSVGCRWRGVARRLRGLAPSACCAGRGGLPAGTGELAGLGEIIPHPVGGCAFLDRPVQAGLVVGDPLLEVSRHVPHLSRPGVVVKDRKTDAAALRVPLGELEPLRVLPSQLVTDVGKGVTVAGVVIGEPDLVPDDKVQPLPPLEFRFRIRRAVPLSARY